MKQYILDLLIFCHVGFLLYQTMLLRAELKINTHKISVLLNALEEKSTSTALTPRSDDTVAIKTGRRKPRTQSQKEEASKRKKEWWDKKKASDRLWIPKDAPSL